MRAHVLPYLDGNDGAHNHQYSHLFRKISVKGISLAVDTRVNGEENQEYLVSSVESRKYLDFFGSWQFLML